MRTNRILIVEGNVDDIDHVICGTKYGSFEIFGNVERSIHKKANVMNAWMSDDSDFKEFPCWIQLHWQNFIPVVESARDSNFLSAPLQPAMWFTAQVLVRVCNRWLNKKQKKQKKSQFGESLNLEKRKGKGVKLKERWIFCFVSLPNQAMGNFLQVQLNKHKTEKSCGILNHKKKITYSLDS
jgi:hypothetical protein